ncbi:MAG TPA: HupE/UreJ family protein [Chitinophagaceae bacterium]|nr:HupE/UreJ family protein [Chitinophagaceae bacterium]
MKKINRQLWRKIVLKGKSFYCKTILLLLLLFSTNLLYAHDVVRELENMSQADTAFLYLELGYKHILPLGLDHILFVVSLFLLSAKLKPLLWQSLTFTIAHSITLGLAMYNVIKLPAAIVEPLIALSIMYVALENVFIKKLRTSRIAVVFLFGLIHGLGFAGALSNLGLPQNSYLVSLIMFNVGVELGQLTVILIAFMLVGKWFGQKVWYHKFIVTPLSLIIAAIALFWVIQRTLL